MSASQAASRGARAVPVGLSWVAVLIMLAGCQTAPPPKPVEEFALRPQNAVFETATVRFLSPVALQKREVPLSNEERTTFRNLESYHYNGRPFIEIAVSWVRLQQGLADAEASARSVMEQFAQDPAIAGFGYTLSPIEVSGLPASRVSARFVEDGQRVALEAVYLGTADQAWHVTVFANPLDPLSLDTARWVLSSLDIQKR